MMDFSKENKGKVCYFCRKSIIEGERIVILNFNGIISLKVLFHFNHYRKYYEMSKNGRYLENELKFERLLELTPNELNEEGEIAKDLGFAFDFSKDLNKLLNYILCYIVKKTIEARIRCPLLEQHTSLKVCFGCKFDKCPKTQFYYNILPEMKTKGDNDFKSYRIL